jgi:hypothetical protein
MYRIQGKQFRQNSLPAFVLFAGDRLFLLQLRQVARGDDPGRRATIAIPRIEENMVTTRPKVVTG